MRILPIIVWLWPLSSALAMDGRHGFVVTEGADECLKKAFSAPGPAGLDAAWAFLSEFYGSALPITINVTSTTLDHSEFRTTPPLLLIAKRRCEESVVNTLTHEASHIALAQRTHKLSLQNENRFWDEGLATVLAVTAEGGRGSAKGAILKRAAMRAADGDVSLPLLRKWNSGYKATSFAYEVAASFIFFLEESFRKYSLENFIRTLDETRSLSRTLRKLFHRSEQQIEEEWNAYLAKISIPERPHIMSRFPADEAKDLSCRIKELKVTFDVPMNTDVVCVSAPASAFGLNYKSARWKNRNELVWSLGAGLAKNVPYILSLGTSECRLRSLEGRFLPVTPWRFTCVDEE